MKKFFEKVQESKEDIGIYRKVARYSFSETAYGSHVLFNHLFENLKGEIKIF